MRQTTSAKPRLACRAESASTATPFAIGARRFGVEGQAACCAAETQLSQVSGRFGRSASGGYQLGGRCSVASTGTPGAGR
jgi:hypothetical protein